MTTDEESLERTKQLAIELTANVEALAQVLIEAGVITSEQLAARKAFIKGEMARMASDLGKQAGRLS